MSYELKQGEGSAFTNKRKDKDSHPDFTGEINIGGTLHWLDIWQNVTRDGAPWFKIKFREKQVKTGATTPPLVPKTGKTAARLIDDEVPF